MAAAALQGSLSCKSVLGLIITKSVYLLKDTEKIGLYIQLIKEAWKSICEIYRVPGNSEFTEMLHLILFAFDQVSRFAFVVIRHIGVRVLPRPTLRGNSDPARPFRSPGFRAGTERYRPPNPRQVQEPLL
jgi:hypothetical protein